MKGSVNFCLENLTNCDILIHNPCVHLKLRAEFSAGRLFLNFFVVFYAVLRPYSDETQRYTTQHNIENLSNKLFRSGVSLIIYLKPDVLNSQFFVQQNYSLKVVLLFYFIFILTNPDIILLYCLILN